MISKAFIQELGNRQMEPEMRDVLDELTRRGIPVELFTEKQMHRRQLPLTPSTLVVAYVPVFLSALRCLNIPVPPTNDYPRSLEPYLRRRLWKSTIRDLVEGVEQGKPPVFAKPDGRKKRFTGRVFRSTSDLAYLEGASLSTPLVCSDVLDWVSEYRVFVIHGQIVGVRYYDGDNAAMIDMALVTEAVARLEQAGEATAGYAVDFGVTEKYETALVEWNDGYSLGSYGLDKAHYTDLLIARWQELAAASQQSEG